MSTTTEQHAQTTERLLRMRQVEGQVGLKKTAIYDLIKQQKFPAPVKVGSASLWPESKVQAWIAEQINGQTQQAA